MAANFAVQSRPLRVFNVTIPSCKRKLNAITVEFDLMRPAWTVGWPLDAFSQMRRNEIRQWAGGFFTYLYWSPAAFAGPRHLRGAPLCRKTGSAVPDC